MDCIYVRILNQLWISGTNPTKLWCCVILLIFFWTWFPTILWRIFAFFKGVVLIYSFHFLYYLCWAFLVTQTVKNLPAMQETQVQSLGQEDPLEKGMAAHSSILAWSFPWTEEPGRIQSMGSQRVRHDWATKHSTWEMSFPGDSDSKESACNAGGQGSIPGLGRSPGKGNGNPLQYFCLEDSTDREPGGLHGVANSWTWLSNEHFHFLSFSISEFLRVLRNGR